MQKRIITLSNVIRESFKDDVISISQVYSYRTPKFWSLNKEITVELSNKKVIVIPEGFVTDGSTVPKFLWGLFPPYGDFLLAAIIHDYLYIYNDKHNMTRKQVDEEMLIWSRVLNEKRNFDNIVRYYCVRVFGWTYWNDIIKFKRSKKII